MYEHEEVEENEGKEFAKELNAIFQKTSAKESTGIEDLFAKIGKEFLDPSGTEGTNPTKNDAKDDKKNIKLSGGEINKIQKKGCC